MSSIASSHSMRVNRPSPFGPVRTAGYCSRASPYTRSPNFLTFAQMYPAVGGFSAEPSISTTRPLLTVTARLHESGQSSGHAVSTTTFSIPCQHNRWQVVGGRWWEKPSENNVDSRRDGACIDPIASTGGGARVLARGLCDRPAQAHRAEQQHVVRVVRRAR